MAYPYGQVAIQYTSCFYFTVLLSKFIYNRHFRSNAYDETNMSPHQYFFLKYQIIHAKTSKRLDGNGSAKYQIIVKKKKKKSFLKATCNQIYQSSFFHVEIVKKFTSFYSCSTDERILFVLLQILSPCDWSVICICQCTLQ